MATHETIPRIMRHGQKRRGQQEADVQLLFLRQRPYDALAARELTTAALFKLINNKG